eukprot:SAG11_NODE_54_length_19571_cov_29.437786_24_plen_224_part_00
MLPLLLLARVLRVNSLGSACTAYLREHLTNASQAPFIYALAMQLGLQKVEQASASVIAHNFGTYMPITFSGFKVSAFLYVVGHAQLQVTPQELCRTTAAFVEDLRVRKKLRKQDFDALVENLGSEFARQSNLSFPFKCWAVVGQFEECVVVRTAVNAADAIQLLRTAFEVGSVGAFAFVCFNEAPLQDKLGLPLATFCTLLENDGLLVKHEDSCLELVCGTQC